MPACAVSKEKEAEDLKSKILELVAMTEGKEGVEEMLKKMHQTVCVLV